MTTGFGFASIAEMQVARINAAATALTDQTKVLVTGGEGSNGPDSAELYDSSGSWTPSQMTTARSRHTATLLNSGQVLVVGGENSVDPSTAEVYNPASNSWQEIFNRLNAPRNAHTATLLADGRVLVTGGAVGPGDSSSLSTAEIFDPGSDPVNGSWTLVNPMQEARAFHTATLLPDGTVLVAGGTPGGGVPDASVELFDPATGVWSLTSSMNVPRSHHTATLLNFEPLGEVEYVVLVAGGWDGSSALFSVEQYLPPSPVVGADPRTDKSEASAEAGS
jgi:N-acetylneuraminic acid mutarotase